MCTAFGSPWPATAIVKAGGAVLWPLTFYQVRWQWWLRYYGTDKQVLVGDTVRIGIVADIRQCGRIAISYAKKITWVSPAQIDARWTEYCAGKLVHEYGQAKHTARAGESQARAARSRREESATCSSS
jgi:hypothetical protein